MKVGLFFGSFEGGGAERMMVNLAKGLSKDGLEATIYVVNKTGPYLKEVPDNIRILSYDSKFGVKSVIHSLRKTLVYDGLDAIISTQMHINSALGLASIGLKKRPLLIFREANTPTKIVNSKFIGRLYKYFYSFADHYVAVSRGVKKDMMDYFKLEESTVTVIYNPVLDDTMYLKMNDEVEHPWFNNFDIPVIVGMGRFSPQKGFEDLVDAFEIVRKHRKTRLVIFGKKDESSAYFQMIKNKVEKSVYKEDIALLGFVDNPFKYLKKANLFVLSSKFEGLPGVLIQAMACGCPVVSTDCPSGPIEILDNGRYGSLVEVGDVNNLGRAMIDTLENPKTKIELKERAKLFSTEKASYNYIQLIRSLRS